MFSASEPIPSWKNGDHWHDLDDLDDLDDLVGRVRHMGQVPLGDAEDERSPKTTFSTGRAKQLQTPRSCGLRYARSE